MHNTVHRIAAIHNISGFGRTSLTIIIPILSNMRIQVCPLPTAAISTHTVDFVDVIFFALTSELGSILSYWEKVGIVFDEIYSEFLAAPKQMDSVIRCIKFCMIPKVLTLINPVLGDNRALDPTMTQEMVERMRWVISFAKIITPNFTELSLSLNKPYQKTISIQKIKNWLYQLSTIRPKIIVATSVTLLCSPQYTSVIAFEQVSQNFWRIDCPYIPTNSPEPGDIFTNILMGSLLQGDSLPIVIDRTVQFVTLGYTLHLVIDYQIVKVSFLNVFLKLYMLLSVVIGVN